MAEQTKSVVIKLVRVTDSCTISDRVFGEDRRTVVNKAQADKYKAIKALGVYTNMWIGYTYYVFMYNVYEYANMWHVYVHMYIYPILDRTAMPLFV